MSARADRDPHAAQGMRLAKQYQRMFEMEGVKLRFHEDA